MCCCVLDGEGRILAVNARMTVLLGGAPEGLEGTGLGEFLAPGDGDLLHGHLATGSGRFVLRLRKGGVALACALSNAAAPGHYNLIADRLGTAPGPTAESRLRVLNQIANRLEFGQAEGFAPALQLAAEYLGMDAAIISLIQGDTYTVAHCWSRDNTLEAGAVFPYRDTYCSITLEGGDVTAIDHMAESPYKGHPCYAASQLEAYIGVPFWVEGLGRGTLNFSRLRACDNPWGQADREFVALMGQWVSQCLARLSMETALASSERRFRTLLLDAPVGIYVIDAAGACVMVNETWRAITGLAQEQALGEDWSRGIYPEDRETVMAAWQQAVAEKREFKMEFRWQQPDGAIVWSSSSARPLRDGEGNLEGYIGTLTDITGRKAYETTLERQARVDELTGLPNRRAFEHALHSEIARSMRYGTPLSLLLIDLDHFKSVNDTYGHDTGDQVLRAVAYTLEASVRVADTPARYGGEEFALLLPQTRLKEASAFSERIRQRLARLAHKTPAGDTLQVTCSIGAAEFDAEAPDERRMVKAADEALYDAKAAGRNCVRTKNPVKPPTESA